MELSDALVSLLVFCSVIAGQLKPSGVTLVETLSVASGAVNAVLDSSTDDTCTLIILTDGSLSSYPVIQEVRSRWDGITVEMKAGNPLSDNVTHLFVELLPLARQVRQQSWCSCVVVVSLDFTFLEKFGEWSLRSRLLVRNVLLLVVTSLAWPSLLNLMSSSQTFATMTAAFINVQHDPTPTASFWCGVYVHLPYSPAGAEVVHVASWTNTSGLQLHRQLPLLPDKYSNMNGAEVNVAARPYMPYWGETHRVDASGVPVTRYLGPDFQMLKAVSTALNFSFRIMATESWTEVEDKVTKRECFLVPIVYMMIIVRLQRFDFTYNYLFDGTAFVMAKPTMEIKWQGLYRPLSWVPWACVAASLLSIAVVLWLMSKERLDRRASAAGSFWKVLQDVMGLLVGQGLPQWVLCSSSSRIVVATWLICSYVIVSVYIGNLTASLTLPKIPPRAETIAELEAAVDRVTMKSYMMEMRETLRKSVNPVQIAISQKMTVVSETQEAMKEVLEKREAYIENGRVLKYMIAKHFTERDGSTRLYVGREQVLPAFLGWLLPHDAPYKTEIDQWLMTVVESGMYMKWTQDVLRTSRTSTLLEQRKKQSVEKELEKKREEVEGTVTLTMKHLQGSFFLLFIGTSFAFLIFILEVLREARNTLHLTLSQK